MFEKENIKKPEMRSKNIYLLLLITLLGVSNLLGQDGNKANRYINAYKQYLNARCPLAKDSIKHFVYFAGDRQRIRNHPFLKSARFKGAQIMYSWRKLEPEKGKYDFTIIKEDYDYLFSQGKKLFIQLQDATFNPKYKGIPTYLLSDEYHGGAAIQFNDDGLADGWVAKRWDPAVQKRFAALLKALGQEFDGKIEGINLQESAIGVSTETDASFTPENYVIGLKANMLSLAKAFPNSSKLQYANFMPDEWLPWDDKGYLRSIYAYGEQIGVGLGGPDLMFSRKGNLNHTIAMMHENEYTVPLGIAIQDGNYIGKTGNDKAYHEHTDKGSSGRKNIVPVLHAFAKEFLKVDYMFWVDQDPYFKEDLMPCFSSN